MKETVSNKAISNFASLAGLALGCVSAAYLLITENISEWINSPVAVSVINMVLWIAKFVGSIALMKYFMKRLVLGYEGVKNGHTLKLGILASAFSALIFSATILADMLYINPDAIKEAYDMTMSIYGSSLDSNTLKAMEDVKGNLPTISFFAYLIYCFLYGLVLSAILARSIPNSDHFAEFRAEEQEDHTTDEER